MNNRPRIAIVGPGMLGSALARALQEAGYGIDEIFSRPNSSSRRRARLLAKQVGAVGKVLKNGKFDAEIVWLCVPDREIAKVAAQLSLRGEWSGKTVFHSSGALSSSEISELRRLGAATASVHPMMTFVSGSIPSLQGVAFALEGDGNALRMARRIARDLGGKPFTIPSRKKAAYHALGSFVSPLVIALMMIAERVGRAAGLSAAQTRSKIYPLLLQTIENYSRLGAARALSGPVVRGDTATVREHLRAIKVVPGGEEVYVALTRAALAHAKTPSSKALRKVLKDY